MYNLFESWFNPIKHKMTFFKTSWEKEMGTNISLCWWIIVNFVMYDHSMGFPGGSAVKNLPAMQEMWVQSLGQEDLLKEVMTIYSSILACRITSTEKPGGLQSIQSQRVSHDWSNRICHMHPHIEICLTHWTELVIVFLTNFHSLAVPGTYKMYLKRTEVMPSGLIPSCQIEGAKMETVTDFLFLSSKITAWWLKPWN